MRERDERWRGEVKRGRDGEKERKGERERERRGRGERERGRGERERGERERAFFSHYTNKVNYAKQESLTFKPHSVKRAKLTL